MGSRAADGPRTRVGFGFSPQLSDPFLRDGGEGGDGAGAVAAFILRDAQGASPRTRGRADPYRGQRIRRRAIDDLDQPSCAPQPQVCLACDRLLHAAVAHRRCHPLPQTELPAGGHALFDLSSASGAYGAGDSGRLFCRRVLRPPDEASGLGRPCPESLEAAVRHPRLPPLRPGRWDPAVPLQSDPRPEEVLGAALSLTRPADALRSIEILGELLE